MLKYGTVLRSAETTFFHLYTVIMKWRVLILVLTGIAMIYFVSLLQDVPYPHPLIIQATTPETARIDEPNQTLLTIHNDYIYRTQIHYKAVHDKNKHFVRGIDPIQTDVRGMCTNMSIFYIFYRLTFLK